MTVRLRAHGRLTPTAAGDVLVTVSVGPGGEAVALWATPEAREALSARRRDAGSRRPVEVRVTTQNGGGVRAVTPIAALDRASCLVQPLPGGAFLVVATRRRGAPGNATVFDAAGQPVRVADLGDGIAHVLTTPAGHVWVGYFDEGVYGDDPVAHHGIVRFGADLTPVWTYPFDTGFGPVDDCYALNVDGETAWSCYYNGFPIVRIADATVTGWHNRTAGADCLIAAGDAAALVGGYRDGRDRLVPGALAGDSFEPAGTLRIALPDGAPPPRERRLVGRGPDLHLFTGTDWYRLGLDDVV